MRENRDLLTERLRRLREERGEIEGRLGDLEAIPTRTTAKMDVIVDAMLAGLADARRMFDQGTVEEGTALVSAREVRGAPELPLLAAAVGT